MKSKSELSPITMFDMKRHLIISLLTRTILFAANKETAELRVPIA